MNTDPPKVHRNLCGLRYDNRFAFGADSARGITSTCFNDVILEPLATWILLAILLPFLALMLRRSSRKGAGTPLVHYRRNHHRWSRLVIVLNVIYMLLVIAALLMSKYYLPSLFDPAA